MTQCVAATCSNEGLGDVILCENWAQAVEQCAKLAQMLQRPLDDEAREELEADGVYALRGGITLAIKHTEKPLE